MVWALRAIAEAPELREPLGTGAGGSLRGGGLGRAWSTTAGGPWTSPNGPASISTRTGAWGAYPWDAMAYACYRIGDLRAAGAYGEQALLEEPDNPRLLENMRFYVGNKGGGYE